MVADVYDEDKLGSKWDTIPVPDEYKEEALKRRNELIEAVLLIVSHKFNFVTSLRIMSNVRFYVKW